MANAKERSGFILDAMVEQGWLDRAGRDAAQFPEVVEYKPRVQGGVAGYIVEMVKQELVSKHELTDADIDLGGLRCRKWRHDALQIRKVLRQLVSNAVKFTDDGEVRVRVTALPGEALRFEVIDSGPGIPPELREKIFERFYQIDGSWTRRSGGSGLGLAICRHLVSLWGGEVRFSPRGETGSIFWFTVPDAVPSAND